MADMSYQALTGKPEGLWVFTVYDGVGGTTYEYATDSIGANLYEQELNEDNIDYDLEHYASVADFIENCQEVSDNGFTDKEKVEFIIGTLKAIGV